VSEYHADTSDAVRVWRLQRPDEGSPVILLSNIGNLAILAWEISAAKTFSVETVRWNPACKGKSSASIACTNVFSLLAWIKIIVNTCREGLRNA